MAYDFRECLMNRRLSSWDTQSWGIRLHAFYSTKKFLDKGNHAIKNVISIGRYQLITCSESYVLITVLYNVMINRSALQRNALKQSKSIAQSTCRMSQLNTKYL